MHLFFRRFMTGAALALTQLGLTSAALAQPQQIEVDASQNWSHKWTGLTIPPQYEGYVRGEVSAFVPDELNVAVQLLDENRETYLTVYIYRAASPNISIWSDRALTALVTNPRLGNPVPGQLVVGRFTPLNDSGADSGFHAVTSLEGARMKATGVSLFAHDDWIIKIRASSSALGSAEITDLIGRVISGLGLGGSGVSYPPVTLIEPCEEDLEFATKLKLRQFDMMGQMLFPTIAGEISVAEKGRDAAGETWCRDRQSSAQVGIYRSGNGKDSYFAALGDSGIGAFVAKFGARELFKTSGYLVKTSDGAEERTWPLFDKLPHPLVIAENYGSVSPVSTSNISPGGDGGSTIHISPDSIRD